MRTLLLCSFFLFFSLFCFSQKTINDSLVKYDTTLIKSVSLNSNFILYSNFDSVGKKYSISKNTISNLLYDSLSWQYKNNGNIGSPFSQLVFSENNSFVQTSLSKCPILYFNSLKQNDLLIPLRPYTEVFYTSGSNKENYFYIKHFQQIKRNFLLGLKQNLISSQSSYFKERSNHRVFSIYGLYFQKRYRIFSKFDFLNYRQNENGGIANPSAFLLDSNKNSLLYPVNLANAQYNNRQINFSINQSILLNNDSISKSIFIFNKSRFSNERSFYIDYEPQNGFYPSLDSTLTKLLDSINISQYTNELGLSFKTKKQLSSLGIEYSYCSLYHNTKDTTLYDLMLNLDQTYLFKQTKIFTIKFKYGLKGFYKNNFDANIRFESSNNNTFNYLFNIGSKKINHNYLNNTYSSDVFNWNYSLNPQQSFYVNTNIDICKFFFYIDINSISNYLYYNTLATPVICKSLNVIDFKLSKTFNFKRFSLESNNIIQKSSNSSVVPLPLYVFNYKLSFSFKLLKGLLNNKFGIEMNYYSKYKANAFMPVTGIYYNQNKIDVGNYPYIDIFATAYFKQAQFFIKLQHANAGFNGRNYFNSPNYPYLGRVFRLGILWKIWG